MDSMVAIHLYSIQAKLQFPFHPFMTEFIRMHRMLPIHLTPNSYQILTCFLTKFRKVGIAPSIHILLQMPHVLSTRLFMYLQP